MGIVRIILGVVGGYVAMAVPILLWAFAVVPAVWPELATVNGVAPEPDLKHPGFIWELPVNLLAGGLGGLACGLIAGKGRRLSAIILVALMIVMSIPALFYTDVKPLWATIAAPLLGSLGVYATVMKIERGRQRS